MDAVGLAQKVERLEKESPYPGLMNAGDFLSLIETLDELSTPELLDLKADVLREDEEAQQVARVLSRLVTHAEEARRILGKCDALLNRAIAKKEA